MSDKKAKIRHTTGTSTGPPIFEWELIARYADLTEVVRVLPPERVIQLLGADRVIQAVGPEKALDALLAHVTPEQIQEMLRRRQQGSKPTEGSGG
jgi:hypothetical protein